MRINKTSSLTGKAHELEINVTPKQWRLYKNGMSIEESMPHLTPSEAAYIASGITEEEWKDAMKNAAIV